MITARLACAPRRAPGRGNFWTMCSQNLSCHQVSFFLLPTISLALSRRLASRDKRKVHMAVFLVHMHHSGNDCFSGLVLLKEAECFLKILPDFRQLLALKELRRGGEQDFHHPNAVFSGAASSGADLSFGSARYRRGGSIRWKFCLLREKSMSGLLAYFSFCARYGPRC